MRLIILISIVIIILIFLGLSNYNKENYYNPNDVVNLGTNLITTKKNIFYGFNKNQAEDLREKLKKFKELNLSKSNIIISENQVFDHLHLDNNKVHGYTLNDFKYHNTIDRRKVIFKDNNNNDIYFNHKTQKNTQYVPTSVCIGEACIEKDHLLMINGDSTVKLRESDSYNYLQPTSIHYSGLGSLLVNEECSGAPPRGAGEVNPPLPDKCPVHNIFYDMSPLGDLNPNCDPQINSQIWRYDMFYRFGLQTPDGKFLRAYPNGFIDLAPHLLTWETFSIPLGNMFFFRNYMENRPDSTFMSHPLGFLSYHNRYLCHERHWFYGCDSIKAIWNRGAWNRWEHMAFVTAFHTNLKKDLAVYIYSYGCGGVLSTEHGIVHFSKNLNPDFCTFRIVPIYDKCSEGCKADYTSTSACCGSNETEIPKNLQCPRDRPKCRFYHPGSKVYGKCFKENPRDRNGLPKFNQDTPHHCKFATANRSGYKNSNSAPQITDNDTFYNEYTISLAKNEKNQLYEKDTYSHIHKHAHNEDEDEDDDDNDDNDD